MTVIWISDFGVRTVTGGTRSVPERWNTPEFGEAYARAFPAFERSPMADILDEFRAMLAKARAPRAILIAAIRDALRCVPRLAVALPGPQCSSSIRRRPRRRDIRHGDALLNVHRMPA